MQDIKHKWVGREISNRKYGRIVSRFEHTCSTSPPSTLWRIFTITISQDHSVPQHLQWASSRTLGPASPSLVSARATHANPQAWDLNLYNSSIQWVEHLWSLLLITKINSLMTRILEDKYSIGKLKPMWEKLNRCCCEKLKKSLLKEQVIHSWKTLFWRWNEALKLVEKLCKRALENS